MNPHVLVGGKDRKEVLDQELKRLEGLAQERQEDRPVTGHAPEYPPSIKGPTEFSFSNHGIYAMINGVHHVDTHYRVQLYTTPIPNESDTTQKPDIRCLDAWVSFNYHHIRNPGSSTSPVVVPSAAFLTKTLYTILQRADYKDYFDLIELWRCNFQKTLDTHTIWTTTSFRYDPSTTHITHHTPFETANALTTSAITALFDMDPAHIQHVYKWATGKHTACNFQTVSDTWPKTRGVSLRPNGETYNLDATTKLDEELPAIGMRIWRIEPEGGNFR